MMLPFRGTVPSHYYEMALSEAGALLGSPGSSLSSLKIRPITKWPINNDDEFRNAQVYRSEYELVLAWLTASALKRVHEGWVSRGVATSFVAPSGDHLVFVEHETGPEIVAALGVAAASVTLVKEIVSLVKEILKAINDKNEAKRRGELSARYYAAAAISIEERTQSTSRIIRVIPLPLKATDIDEAAIEKLLRSK